MKLATAHSASDGVNGQPRVGLVLGAGGILGGAWLVGALHAIASETGWDPGSADYIVGTSAGSLIGGLIACGVPPWFIVARSAGETFDGLTGARGEATGVERSGGGIVRLDRGGFALGPGSWRLALSSLARPHRYSPAAVVVGWLPHGIVSTEPLKDIVRRVCPTGWSPHPNFWAVAVDYTTGRRVAFGRSGSPPAHLPDAIAASCAIPGFYRDVRINGRAYIDGGVYSTSNLDVLRNERLDIVLALNPMSSQCLDSPRTVAGRVASAVRQASGRRLYLETDRLRAAGTEVALIQPTPQDLEVMGLNLMSGSRRHEVVQTAIRTMTRHLHDTGLGERLAKLSTGDRARALGPGAAGFTWPDFTAAARDRWDEARAA